MMSLHAPILLRLFKNKICILAVCVFHSIQTPAQNDLVTRLGDIGALALPASAMIPAFVHGKEDQYHDFTDMAWAYGATITSTYALKFARDVQRPDGDRYSFPSGHTSSAFSGATLIQMRYGTKFGLPAFLLAGFVGYSRVQAERHYWADVIGGAVLGTGLTYFVYKKWSKKWNIYPLAGVSSVGFQLNYSL